MHALLNDNGEDDLLCVQEPWSTRLEWLAVTTG
jgi:hypothetical protein